LSPGRHTFWSAIAEAACPELTAKAARPPSNAAIFCSSASQVGFMMREYMLPKSLSANRFAACSVLRNW
jgi:hypothetical protein